MRLLVDLAAFEHPLVLAAAVRRYCADRPVTEYALVPSDDIDVAAATFRHSAQVLTIPLRRRLWGLLDPETDPFVWQLEVRHGLTRAKASEIARKYRGSATAAPWNWEKSKFAPAIRAAVDYGLELENLEYRPVWQPAPAAPGSVSVRADRAYRVVTDADAWGLLVELDSVDGPVALDFETNGGYPLGLDPVGFSFAWEPGVAYYVPLRHQDAQNVRPALARGLLATIVDKQWIAHNAIFELHCLASIFGCDIATTPEDTMLLAWHCGDTKGLKDLAASLLGEHMDTWEETVRGTDRDFTRVPVARAMAYGCADADMTLRLYRLLTEG